MKLLILKLQEDSYTKSRPPTNFEILQMKIKEICTFSNK